MVSGDAKKAPPIREGVRMPFSPHKIRVQTRLGLGVVDHGLAAPDEVPSVDGISHSPLEFSTPESCANGAQVLMELLLAADQRM